MARIPSRLLAATILATGFSGAFPARAAERRPVPTVTIYPGDVIRSAQLADQEFPDAIASAAYAADRTVLIGKVARRTLLPGRPIPANAVGEPRLVTVGARVRVIYEDAGLTITAYGAALQAGGAGDIISVRNVESNVTVGGTIAPDGSVRVGPG